MLTTMPKAKLEGDMQRRDANTTFTSTLNANINNLMLSFALL